MIKRTIEEMGKWWAKLYTHPHRLCWESPGGMLHDEYRMARANRASENQGKIITDLFIKHWELWLHKYQTSYYFLHPLDPLAVSWANEAEIPEIYWPKFVTMLIHFDGALSTMGQSDKRSLVFARPNSEIWTSKLRLFDSQYPYLECCKELGGLSFVVEPKTTGIVVVEDYTDREELAVESWGKNKDDALQSIINFRKKRTEDLSVYDLIKEAIRDSKN